MKSDAHLFVSMFPLRPGESVAAMCGDPIIRAEIQCHWDCVPVNVKFEISEEDAKGICRKCLKALKPKKGQREFIYAVRSR
jgi:hypothetical protein